MTHLTRAFSVIIFLLGRVALVGIAARMLQKQLIDVKVGSEAVPLGIVWRRSKGGCEHARTLAMAAREEPGGENCA